jgi:hypothetical protein
MILLLKVLSVFERFEILSALLINIQVLWDIMLCPGLLDPEGGNSTAL